MPKRYEKFFSYSIALVGVIVFTAATYNLANHINPTTVALTFLLFVLFIATLFGSKPALVASFAAMLCLNYFFLPPIGTLTIAAPENWIALFAFLVVAITTGQLSAKAKRRAEEAERLYAELQEAFEKASEAEAAKQSEKLKSALLDAVTHDLRTPLTSIKASVTMLIEEQKNSIHVTLEPQGRAELLEIINEESDRLNDFVESMVEIAKIEAGEFNLRKTPIEVEEIVSAALYRAERLTINHQIKLDIQKNLPKISVDAKAIAEVIYNLLDNAVKYSPPQSTITIFAKQIEGFLEMVVEDEGEGVSADERAKIFQKFYRANKSKKGFGMGLAIVRGIIESHGGKIWVENGKIGSRFVFEIPIKSDG
ncbi:MAG: sensor histidine kinase [Pyrinomonadaceae bacterium]